jgi:hypothetical protein
MHRSKLVIALAGLTWMLAVCACSHKERVTEPEPKPYVPTLNSGYFWACWQTQGPGVGNPAITRVDVSYNSRKGGAPLASISGEVKATFSITLDEFWPVFEAVEDGIFSRDNQNIGCLNGGPSEDLMCFSGDYGQGAAIQGCVTHKIQRAREAVWALAFDHCDEWALGPP